MKKKVHICEACGMGFETTAHNIKYCPDCRQDKYLELARKNAKERYWKLRREKVTPTRERDYKPTLCFECKNAVPTENTGCEWSRSFGPVKGWIAKYNEKLKSYNVRQCPEFKKG